MLYLNYDDIEGLGIDWPDLCELIAEAVRSLEAGDFSQPIKPYLRYRDLTNRIIAMPAYLGGKNAYSGIKWIASFPGNLDKNIPRAHSVVILNEADTGRPLAIVNTALLSGIRTAAVTGLVIREYDRIKGLPEKIKVGMTGFGPIGRLHLSLVQGLLGERISEVGIYDPRGVDLSGVPQHLQDMVKEYDNWEGTYEESDVYMTCTVSAAAYIDRRPKPGSLQLNVSLRDYKPEFLDFSPLVVVDDWDEACRENTDIEVMHLQRGLQRENSYNINDLVCRPVIQDMKDEEVLFFNPMGMAVFDIAVAGYYYQLADERNAGTRLPD